MILTKKIAIKVNKRNYNYLKNKYNCELGDFIDIKPEDLSNGSHAIIDVSCDVCGKKRKIIYKEYYKSIKKGGYYSCSRKCSQDKIKESVLEKYGVENPFQSKIIKNKIKETNLKNYGVENPMFSDKIKNKLKQSSLKNHGVDHYSKTDEFKEKYKETILKNHGVDHYSQTDEFKEKYKETILKNHGVDHYSKTDEFKEKYKETILKNHGVDHYSKTDEFKEKVIKSSLIKYGTTHPLKNDKVKEKLKNTNIKKYGFNTPLLNEKIKKKINQINLEKYGHENIYKSKEIRSKIIKSRKNNTINKIDNLIEIDENGLYLMRCDKNHTYKISSSLYNLRKNRYNSTICTICNPIGQQNESDSEKQLLKIIEQNYSGEIITNSKSIIKPYELDIYLPELKLAFEFNGVYWHNELYKSNNYHKIKSDLCDELGIQLIHIYEDDWIYNFDVINSSILNKLRKTPNKIYGRKTEVKEITDNKLVRDFLVNNHIQGFVGSSTKLGLYYNNELVSLMTFGKKRNSMNTKSNNDTEYEMLRFCNKKYTNVIGGASKLFKYFLRNYNVTEIISYADRSYSNGNLYNQLGFKLSHITTPNYYYVINDIRKHRYNYRKDILVKEGYDANKTEHEIMLDRKIYRIYNSGNYKFIFTIK